MSIGSVIKRVAHGVGNELRQAVQPQAEAPINAAIPPDAPLPQYKPIDLPEIDPNDPDAADKQKVHDYIRALEQAHSEYAASQPDYHQQYQQLADYVNSKPEPKRFDPLSAFAIGMGDINNLSKVADVNAAADKERHAKEDYLLNLREQAMKGNIQRLMEEGKFQQALKESAALQTLNVEQEKAKESRAGKQRLAEIEAQNSGKVAVANIRASAQRDAMERRLKVYADSHGIDQTLMKQVAGLAMRRMGALSTQKNMYGESVVLPEVYAQIEDEAIQDLQDLYDRAHGAGGNAGVDVKGPIKMRFPDNKVRSVSPEKQASAIKLGAVAI
jgi:hypothetical protein